MNTATKMAEPKESVLIHDLKLYAKQTTFPLN